MGFGSLTRAFGDFEADLKRSDSEPIPDQKERFLSFMCSLNTFQSKRTTYTLSSLHFQPDEKRGNGYKNQKRREAKPVPKSNRWKFIRTCSGWFVQSEIAFCGMQTTPFHLEAIKPRKELEKIRKTEVMGNCGM